MLSRLGSKANVLVSRNQARFLHAFPRLSAEETANATVSKLSKDQLKKREIRRLAQRKAAARRPASDHPLYMSVNKALRFLRAAEVGQPHSQQTLSVTTAVISERGAPPLSGNLSFPNALKEVKVAVFTNDEQQVKLARDKYNCHVVGGAELVEQIKTGEVAIDFDKSFATPDIAPMLASQLGRILGPRGLLPAAKKGTVSDNLDSLLEGSMASLPFRQRGNSVSIAVGKCSFTDKQMLENLVAAQRGVKAALANQKTKKPSLLGQTILTSTHGPGIVIDFA
ncbi:LAME_0G08658g1_1 [Lachancea meyersii CBS 8951]|uniref:Large ribosomal subunit protein uL1m n=1 Tax=Lachancea meyersii CBS 8951 TaxID=1266667 RepID=A0A1G4K8B5_9SACH|nr:LAME_0G08658g1_1 [Lachancea meyersii CBS 8951]